MIKNFKNFILEKFGNQKHFIQDLDDYNVDMSKTIGDKIYFLNYVTPDIVVDFGCADGSTLKEIENINPNIKLIGYDLNPSMLEKAKRNVPNGYFTTNWEDVKTIINNYEKPLLLLSSVIHEVYSYSHGNEISLFWNRVFKSHFKYIFIRDMIPSSKLDSMSVSDSDYNKIKDNISNPAIIATYEKYWGHINSSKRNFIHFLLKYRYFNNWNRELIENYVPITKETLDKKIPDGWKKIYSESFTLPFLKKQVKKDFDIDLVDYTHIKLLLEY